MKKRYLSLDVLRGITVTFMCIVNNPGSWGKIFPPLEHAGWVGCTPTDLVYPFFVFCAGCAMAFSYSKFDSFSKDAFLKLLKRSVLIFLAGFLLNCYPFFPTSVHDSSWSFGQNYMYWLGHRRIFGVLQRIALAYFLGGTIALWLRKPAKIIGAICSIFVLYTGILVAFGTEPGPFTLEGTVSRKVDVALVGPNHVYHGYSYDFEWAKAQEIAAGTYTTDKAVNRTADFDPEGPLGALPGSCTCLLGFLIGSMIIRSGRRFEQSGKTEDSPIGLSCRTFVYGAICLGLGEIMSIWIPICKPLWSASYVLYAGGWAMIALAFLTYVLDVKGITKPFVPFQAMGLNALMAFILSGVIAKSYVFFGFSTSKYFGANEYTSLAYALIFAFVIFCCLWALYKKKIIIRL
ncbi:MAG: heparan-alpha-glucosaminide N-acetyltransferase domain-containing protein [Bacteroidales bacterium]|nr:heparan-alpha-glucosaminide N-acetyltransferase domain-containing protein [Bacteroidales bacterium]